MVAATGTTTTSNSSTEKPTFPDVTVKQICSHMNEDHAVSVFAMAKRVCPVSGGWRISSATMVDVMLEGCQLQVTLCKNKDLCRQEKHIYTFEPPISNPAHVKSKLIAVHHRVCRPDYTKPSFLFVALNVLFLAFLMGYFGRAGLIDFIEKRPNLRRFVRRMIFDSATYATVTQTFFYLTVLAHGLLCAYVGYHARKTLKLTKTGTTEWCLATALGGLTVVGDLRELLRVHFATHSAQKKP
jgi:Protein of unknown function (DUF2470)